MFIERMNGWMNDWSQSYTNDRAEVQDGQVAAELARIYLSAISSWL